MEKIEWWKSGVVYQIYPRSFMDTNDDGIGDIPGIILKLDYLKELGVNIIWLSPVYKSPDDDNGYDISDYKDISPKFGTMKDMDELIVEAKKREIKIIMDLVINHTSDEHEWFQKAINDENSEYRDYYYFKEGNKNKKPNNWTGFFGGSVWSKTNKKDNEYYMHLFSKKQPDLNWHNPKVMEEIKDIMHFWLKKGIAGFRCDVINVIYKNTLKNGKRSIILTGLEHYHSTEGCHNVLKELKKDVLSKYDCFTVGETVLVNTKQANDLCAKSSKELDMVFGFEHMETDQIIVKWLKRKFKPSKWMKVITKWQTEVEWNSNYLENHDQPRSVSRYGNDSHEFHNISAKMLATVYLSLKGTPYVYEGQEIGMTNTDFNNISEYPDIESQNVYKIMKRIPIINLFRKKLIRLTSRDNARQPMQWNKNGGFTNGTPWIKEHSNKVLYNVEDAINDKNSIYHYYRRMLAIRKNSDTLIIGDYKAINQKKSIFAFSRELKEEKYYVIANMSSKNKKINLKKLQISGNLVISNYDDTKINGKIDLRPYESFILKK